MSCWNWLVVTCLVAGLFLNAGIELFATESLIDGARAPLNPWSFSRPMAEWTSVYSNRPTMQRKSLRFFPAPAAAFR